MWSKEQIDILKKLWNRGESARIIALQLRTTRNAVIGKANRLGLPKHPSRAEENETFDYEENNNRSLFVVDVVRVFWFVYQAI